MAPGRGRGGGQRGGGRGLGHRRGRQGGRQVFGQWGIGHGGQGRSFSQDPLPAGPRQGAPAGPVRQTQRRAKAVVDAAACTGCGICLDECPAEAIVLLDGVASIGDDCVGCGVCVGACPNGALNMTDTRLVDGGEPDPGTPRNR